MPPPPPPLSGRGDRRGPYGPIIGRVPVTTPAVASVVHQNLDDMDVGEPDNPMAIAQFVEHLTETSTTTLRRVDSLRINLQLQQHYITHEVQHANRLRQEYLQAVAAMESTLGLQASQDLQRLQQRSEEYYHSRWLALERQAHLEYSQSRAAQMDEVGRFEAASSNVLHSGHRTDSTQTTLLQTELGQDRRQASAQPSTLRAELAQAL
eukprot:6490629-Amphidinium_carterae.3